jgi:enoyl-CoA hydratase
VPDAVRLGFVHEVVPPDRLLEAAIDRARAVPADAMAAYAFAKRALQAPALANIERLADPLDRRLAAGFTDPGNLRAQRAKYEQLTGRTLHTEAS